MAESPISTQDKEVMEQACNVLYREILKFEKEAVAMELASLLVGYGFEEGQFRRTMLNLKENSEIAKKNRAISQKNKKVARLTVLAAKKRLNKAEQQEANKLLRELEK